MCSRSWRFAKPTASEQEALGIDYAALKPTTLGEVIDNRFDDREHSDIPNQTRNQNKIGIGGFDPQKEEQLKQ